MTGRIIIHARQFWRQLDDGRLAPVVAPAFGSPTTFTTTPVNQRRLAAERSAAAGAEAR